MNFEEAKFIYEILQTLSDDKYQALLKIIDINKYRQMTDLLETPPFEKIPPELITMIASAIDLKDIEKLCQTSTKYQWLCSPKGWESILFIKQPSFAKKWSFVRAKLGIKRLGKKLFNTKTQEYITELYYYFLGRNFTTFNILMKSLEYQEYEIYQKLFDLLEKEGLFQKEWYLTIGEYLLQHEVPQLFQKLFEYPIPANLKQELVVSSIEFAVYYTNEELLAPGVDKELFIDLVKVETNEFLYNLFALDPQKIPFINEVQQETLNYIVLKDNAMLLEKIDQEYDIFEYIPRLLKIAWKSDSEDSFEYMLKSIEFFKDLPELQPESGSPYLLFLLSNHFDMTVKEVQENLKDTFNV